MFKDLSYILERNDRRRGIRITLVRIKPKSKSRHLHHDRKIPKALDAYDRKSHGTVFEAIYQRKNLTKLIDNEKLHLYARNVITNDTLAIVS